jgi:hypothetical protein
VHTVYLYSFKDNPEVFIGRSSASGIRVGDDISISRQHSKLSLLSGRLFIQDNKSKFGTLKLITEPVMVYDNTQRLTPVLPIIIQMCNHVIRLEARGIPTPPNYNSHKISR